jgi:hypothetical protein
LFLSSEGTVSGLLRQDPLGVGFFPGAVEKVRKHAAPHDNQHHGSSEQVAQALRPAASGFELPQQLDMLGIVFV